MLQKEHRTTYNTREVQMSTTFIDTIEEAVELLDNGTTLCQRVSHGVVIFELKRLPQMEMTAIQGTNLYSGVGRAAIVPDDKAMDAFEHPCAYLPEPAALFE